jgi:hypothetical protein
MNAGQSVHEEVVWWSSRITGLTSATVHRRSVIHLREPGAKQTLCGMHVDWMPDRRREGDRDCKRCQRRAEAC